MHPRQRLEANLGVIDRAIALICAQAGVRGADAEDFASAVKLALVENDYAIVRKWEGRSSFAAYITIVIRRLFVDQQRAAGRWYASAAAKRQGDAAMLLERLIGRDGRSLEEAFSIVRQAHPEVSREELASMTSSFPARTPPPRVVALDAESEERFAGSERADERVVEQDVERLARQASRIVRDALERMTADDRVILRMRFGEELSVADLARVLGVPQRPLYRRIEQLLAQLRRALESAGVDASSIGDLIGKAGETLDFRLRPGDDAAEANR